MAGLGCWGEVAGLGGEHDGRGDGFTAEEFPRGVWWRWSSEGGGVVHGVDQTPERGRERECNCELCGHALAFGGCALRLFVSLFNYILF